MKGRGRRRVESARNHFQQNVVAIGNVNERVLSLSAQTCLETSAQAGNN
jgi:hypothetical protein